MLVLSVSLTRARHSPAPLFPSGCRSTRDAAERADRNYFWWINPRLKIGSYFQDDSDGNEVVPVGVNGPGDPFTGRAWEQYGGDGATPTLDLYSQIPNLGR